MSQYGSIPHPGPYVPPNPGAAMQPSAYQQKSGATFGQMMNQRLEQAVDVGKPMFNKLGKTISSKLGNKPSPGPPQHLQSYPSYQNHQGQQIQTQGYQPPLTPLSPAPSPSFSPNPQQQQQTWGRLQHQPPSKAPNAHISPQQSPYQQPSYASPASGYSGQSNYFSQQTSQTSNSQPHSPQQPLTTPGYNPAQYGQGGNATVQMAQQGQTLQGQPSALPQQNQRPQDQYGVVGNAQNVPSKQSHVPSASPTVSPQPSQSQWTYPSFGKPLVSATQQQAMPTNSSQPLQSAPSPELQQEQQQQQHWNTTSPVSPHSHGQTPSPHNASPLPPPPPAPNASPYVPFNKPTQPTQPSTPALQHANPSPSPTGFIAELPAELPADMGNLNMTKSRSPGPDPSVQAPQYQAFRPSGSQGGSPSASFTIPRRSISANTYPLADPWRFADATTETPTREFYILADLLFDALDRKFEPRNTGLLEAPKILGSWAKLTEEASRLFSYQSYSAFAKLWSLEGIPHIMVPCQPALTPKWNFNQQSDAHDMKMIAESPTSMSTYATYMPALNRAGWYKFFFFEMMHAPEDIGDLMPVLCADSYKPGMLNHPDLDKRDKTETHALQARAAEMQAYAIGRVCEETKIAMREG